MTEKREFMPERPGRLDDWHTASVAAIDPFPPADPLGTHFISCA